MTTTTGTIADTQIFQDLPPDIWLPYVKTQVATASSPTVSEFLNASNAEYVITGTPAGLRPFTVGGVQVQYVNDFTGVAAKVWVTSENQVVIAYQGTGGGDNIFLNPLIAIPQIGADIAAALGWVSPTELDAVAFAQFVTGLANQQGYTDNNIFVTGHSLGGIEAEYVASQTGLGGMSFEATGLPSWALHSNLSGSNFVNIVNYGDPVGNYSSDINAEQPLAPAYVKGGGTLPHYGSIVFIGDPADQAALKALAAPGLTFNAANDFGLAVGAIKMFIDFHEPGVIAHDTGVTLTTYSVTQDSLGNQSGPVWNISGDTTSQLLAAAALKGVLAPG